MNKSILIYNKNISKKVLQKFDSNQLVEFDYSQDKYKKSDEYISKEIIEKLIKQDVDIIFIKDNLSDNYLELYGLIVAYHIRLTKEIKYIPIVILSDIDGCTLNKVEPTIANILFTKNIFLEPNSISTIEKYKEKKIAPLNENEYKSKFLDLIEVESPENSTNHSISNEWAIERWSYLVGVENLQGAIKANKEKIVFMLHFKYLNQKFLLDSHEVKIHKDVNLKGKLLFIDDNGSSGWNDIIKNYIYKHSNIKYEALISDYQDIDSIKKTVKKSIISFEPNIILLDLRLLKNESNIINKISGIEILGYIKTIDPSIQVIMFTASNDSDILDTLHNKGIFGFVKKDASTDKYISSKSSFKKLNKLIKDASDNIYLQEIYKIQKEIITLNIFEENKDSDKVKELQITVKMVFNVLNSNMPKNLTFAMFSIFKCIEIVTYLYVEEKDKKSFWKGTNKEIEDTGYYKFRKSENTTDIEHIKDENKKNVYNSGNISVENKIRTIMVEKLKLSSNQLHAKIKCLVCIRNYVMHQDKIYEDRDFCKNIINKEITTKNIIVWFRLIEEIIISIDRQYKSM